MKNFSLIAACDKEMGIGKGGTIPWRLSKELGYFHRVTSEITEPSKRNAVIMGRKTWESIPAHRRPLSGRLNCVITRNEEYTVPEGVMRFSSLEECLDYLDRHPVLDTGSRNKKQKQNLLFSLFSFLDSRFRGNDKKVQKSELLNIEKTFIIGGGELFRQAIVLHECERIYLTEVEGDFGCDTFFPSIPDEFTLTETSAQQEEGGIHYHFVVYTKQR